MMFRGRLVVALLMLAIFSSSVVTLTLVDSSFINQTLTSKEETKETGELEQLAADSGMSAKQLAKIFRVYKLIQDKYYTDVEGEQILRGAVEGMVEQLDDPYSTYFDVVAAEKFQENLESTFQGIGAEVTMRDGKLLVISPIKGSPAEKAGIHPNDQIVSVNGEKLEGLSLYEAVQKIRGPKGTQAKLEILRDGVSAPILIIVVRDKIAVETVYSQMLDGKIGRIEITQFAERTAQTFAEHLKRLEDQGMKALVIDVRSNPGGLLPEVIKISEAFLPPGKAVLRVEYGSKKQETIRAEGGKEKNYPIAVLINEGSASASEILAAALNESANALLIGKPTFGKGTIQNTFMNEMGDGSNLKLTVGKWLTPTGAWINKTGVKPDLELDQPEFFRAMPLSGKTEWKFDQTSEEIRNAQIMLNAVGSKTDREDGYYSQKTKEAVEAFQKKHKLPVTGTLNAATIGRLLDSVRGLVTDPLYDAQLQRAIQEVKKLIQGG